MASLGVAVAKVRRSRLDHWQGEVFERGELGPLSGQISLYLHAWQRGD
jgi:hypothetical protein